MEARPRSPGFTDPRQCGWLLAHRLGGARPILRRAGKQIDDCEIHCSANGGGRSATCGGELAQNVVSGSTPTTLLIFTNRGFKRECDCEIGDDSRLAVGHGFLRRATAHWSMLAPLDTVRPQPSCREDCSQQSEFTSPPDSGVEAALMMQRMRLLRRRVDGLGAAAVKRLMVGVVHCGVGFCPSQAFHDFARDDDASRQARRRVRALSKSLPERPSASS